jgi:hypothetical protein
MDESGAFVNIPKLYPDRSELLSAYVKLQDLPYNRLWKQQLLDRSLQSHAVQVYRVDLP